MNKTLWAKRFLSLLMAVVLAGVFAAGASYLTVKGKETMLNLEPGDLMEMTRQDKRTRHPMVGSVLSSDGTVLWSASEPGNKYTFSLVGTPWGNLPNTIVYGNQDMLFSCDKYDPMKGADSLKGNAEDITITINYELQKHMTDYMLDNHVTGICLAVNYKTGEILCAASTPVAAPGYTDADLEEGALMNKCFAGEYQPGSTMKLVTLGLAVEQFGEEIYSFEQECDGIYTLAGGEEIICKTGNGNHNCVSAMGVSCNSYFAQLIEKLGVHQAAEGLKRMGFQVNGAEGDAVSELGVGLSRSRASFYDHDFDSVWNLIGQQTTVNPISHVQYMAAIANGGSVFKVHLQKQDKMNQEEVFYLEADDADLVKHILCEATDEYYYPYEEGHLITGAKTGTAEHGEGENKLFLGFSEETELAFLCVSEGYVAGEKASAWDVAENLVEFYSDNCCED